MEALLMPSGQTGMKFRALVNRGVIHDHEGFFCESRTEVVETFDDHIRIHRALEYERSAIIVLVHEREHVESPAFRGGNFDMFADRLPGVGDAGSQVETRLVEVAHIDFPAFRELFQTCDFLLGFAEFPFVPFTFKRFSDSFPHPLFFYDPFHRRSTDLLTPLIFQDRNDLLHGTGFLVHHLENEFLIIRCQGTGFSGAGIVVQSRDAIFFPFGYRSGNGLTSYPMNIRYRPQSVASVTEDDHMRSGANSGGGVIFMCGFQGDQFGLGKFGYEFHYAVLSIYVV